MVCTAGDHPRRHPTQVRAVIIMQLHNGLPSAFRHMGT